MNSVSFGRKAFVIIESDESFGDVKSAINFENNKKSPAVCNSRCGALFVNMNIKNFAFYILRITKYRQEISSFKVCTYSSLLHYLMNSKLRSNVLFTC